MKEIVADCMYKEYSDKIGEFCVSWWEDNRVVYTSKNNMWIVYYGYLRYD